MTLFLALAAALTASALAFLLPPLLRRRASAPDARVAANAEVYREQLEELGAELQRGAITKEQFERASREVEHRIVAEHAGENAGGQPAQQRAPRRTAIAVAILVPLAAILGYWQFGEPRALDPQALRPVQEDEMAPLVARLAQRLQEKPDDAEGWALLGRSLAALGQHEQALKALARALELHPDNRELLVELVNALARAGRAAFEERRYAEAAAHWERILPFAPPESDFHRSVAESIAEAKSLAGGAVAKAGAGAAPPTKAAGRDDAALRGVVSIDPALRGRAAPGDVVFILARPADAKGAGPPVAVTRVTVEQLPYSFTLDDSMAMAPGFKLSGQSSVVVTARVSKSGKPARQPGDLEGASAPVKPGAAGMRIVISKTVD